MFWFFTCIAAEFQSSNIVLIAYAVNYPDLYLRLASNDRLLMHLGETVCPNNERVDMLADCQFKCAA
jgi:hypothetical protein